MYNPLAEFYRTFMNTKELKALISLLEDPDPEVYSIVENKILQQGEGIINELEKVWEASVENLIHQRIENIIRNIIFDTVFFGLKKWVNDGGRDLLAAACLISKLQYPEVSFKKISNLVDEMESHIWLKIINNISPLEKIKTLNHLFFEVYQFSKSPVDFNEPKNFYINHLLDTRKGNQISLAMLYMIIAERLNIPIFGVNLPRNFILAYVKYNIQPASVDENRVMFYINPFNKGFVLGRKEIDYFLTQNRIKKNISFYVPCANFDIIQRFVYELIASYKLYKGSKQIIDDLGKILHLFNDENELPAYLV